MTPYSRYIVDMSDIKNIRITCKCEASYLLAIGPKDYIPDTCPGCTASWFLKDTQDKNSAVSLLSSIVGLRERGKNAQCRIQLEIDQP